MRRLLKVGMSVLRTKVRQRLIRLECVRRTRAYLRAERYPHTQSCATDVEEQLRFWSGICCLVGICPNKTLGRA